jgi:hypothetical protein
VSDEGAPTLPETDVIKRTTAPQTVDGIRWEVHLNAEPPREWLNFFKASREASTSAAPAVQPSRVTFDRASVSFRSDAEHVEEWVESLDKWIAWTDARYAIRLDEVAKARSARLDTDARERERIQHLNERFKNL